MCLEQCKSEWDQTLSWQAGMQQLCYNCKAYYYHSCKYETDPRYVFLIFKNDYAKLRYQWRLLESTSSNRLNNTVVVIIVT